MAAIAGKKIAQDIAADRCSMESLSFSGLICIQDQHLKNLSSPLNDATQIQKHEAEFEFGYTKSQPTKEDRKNELAAHLLLFNGELNPQAIASHVTDSSTVTSSKRAKSCNSVSWHVDVEEKERSNKKTMATNSSFGRKIFSSLVSPCRECHATEPSIKGKLK